MKNFRTVTVFSFSFLKISPLAIHLSSFSVSININPEFANAFDIGTILCRLLGTTIKHRHGASNLALTFKAFVTASGTTWALSGM